ncbi:uncharacterized protein LOC110978972 [Acanthaster planci]|uniref:Uncharacterized protein LOC110978972 n=1 Tax=Acanthaster planci TaxID=133434 RepID=A0A8B7YCG1_ACAPL|nr:uncharacterized protein LOC110978972 [Acanthaster planci]XP_022090061.1 uncharacterized protein LOC110978972 [Acanthaster planci]
MITGGSSTTLPVHRFMFILTVLIFTAFGSTSALDYASNISVRADITSATLTWIAASNSSADSYTLALLLDGGATSRTNYTISDVATETYTLTDLTYSTYYTVNLYTVGSGGQTVGVSTLSFWTLYKVWNPSFIAALCVLGFIFITLVVMMALKSAYLAEKKDPDEKPVLEDEQTDKGVKKNKDTDRNGANVVIL